jgi:lysophospholipase L1-like esterase
VIPISMLRRSGLAVWLLVAAFLSGGVASAQDYRKWYLAEGATGRGADFVEDILIANPSATDTCVRITFLLGNASNPPPGFVPTYDLKVAATSRATVHANALPGLSSAEFSAVVESIDDPARSCSATDIVVERTMAWPSATRRGGHNSQGVTSPATRWFLAEGSTGFFNAFVLIANPSATTAARVKVTFLKPGGGTIAYRPNPNDPSVETFDLEPLARYNVWVNAQVPELSGGQAFSTVVESTNGVGIIAERAMYWNTQNVFEGGHEAVGVTQASMTWLFAEGTTKRAPGLAFDTFLLLSNPNAQPARARVRFFTSPGTPPLELFYQLAANSRENVWVNAIPALANRDFSMEVESVPTTSGGPAQPLVAERASYWGPGTRPPSPNWVDGHDTPGATAEARKWAFAEGIEDRFSDTPGLNYDTYFLISNRAAGPLDVRATFVREDGTGIVETFQVPAESRYTLPAFFLPALTNQRFGAFFESTNGVPFVAERAVYWGAGYFAGHASVGTPWTGAIATPPAPPAPTVTGVAPDTGPTSGGTTITVTGTNFTSGPTTVTLGGLAATNVAVVNATTITARTPSSTTTADLTVDVVVTNNGVSRTLAGGFTFVVPKPPTIATIVPSIGPSTGGTSVTITGSNFNPASLVVSFDSIPGTVTEATPTSLKVTTPPHAVPSTADTVAVDVTVNTNGLSTKKTAGFTYAAFTLVDNVLAFGDSITAGVTDCVIVTVPFIQRVCQPGDGGYPVRLEQELEERYSGQSSSIVVQNAGQGGERTEEGRGRLPATMTPAHDLVVILEGINDASAEIPIGAVADNLRLMVRSAKSAGKWVVLGTLTPVTATAFNPDPARVTATNEEIVRIAQQEGVLLADLFAAVSESPAYLSEDGMHPTAAGYRRMADYLADVIRQNFETVPPPK